MSLMRSPLHVAKSLRRLCGDDLSPGIVIELYFLKWAYDAQSASDPSDVPRMRVPENSRWDVMSLDTEQGLVDAVLREFSALERLNPSLSGMTEDLVGSPEYALQRSPRAIGLLKEAIGLLGETNLYPSADDAALHEVSEGLVLLAETFVTARAFRYSAPSKMLCRLLVELADPMADDAILDPWGTWGETLRAVARYQDPEHRDGVNPGVFGYSATPSFHRLAEVIARVSRREQPQLMRMLPSHALSGQCGELQGGFEHVISAPALREPLFHDDLLVRDTSRASGILGLNEKRAIEFALKMVHQEGSVVLGLTSAVLNRGLHLGEVRKALLEQDLVDAVFSVPMGAASRFNIRTAVLVLRHAKPPERREKVFFVTVPDEALRNRRYSSLESSVLRSVVDAYRQYECVDGFSTTVSTVEVIAADADLNPSRYTFELDNNGAQNLRAIAERVEVLQAERDEANERIEEILSQLAALSE